METKPLLYGLIGFFAGGLIVSLAATGLGKPASTPTEMTMAEMTASLRDKRGDDYDKAFIGHMIDHHQAAVDMAKLSATNARHEEIKRLSEAIVKAQEAEIAQMKRWKADWGYEGGEAAPHIGH